MLSSLCVLFGCLHVKTNQDILEEAFEAICNSDIATLERLLDNGLPLDTEYYGHTLWTFAIITRNETVARYLLSKGATPVRVHKGERLIDNPYYNHGATNICELLAIEDVPDALIDGIPEPVWESAFPFVSDDNQPVLLFVNKTEFALTDPAPEVLEWFERKGLKVYAGSRLAGLVYESDIEAPPRFEGTEFRCAESNVTVSCCVLVIKKRSDTHYKLSGRFFEVPTLSKVRRHESEMVKEYGYWFENPGKLEFFP